MNLDSWIEAVEIGLRTLFAPARASLPRPRAAEQPGLLTPEESREAGALMRVNHVGEVCAQAMYVAQALTARNPALATELRKAAHEEGDHLAWTSDRLEALGSRPSLLNPLWFAGAFGIGLVAGAVGDRVSLGFVAETERQVEAHLDGHRRRLPAADTESLAVIQRMMQDEARHALHARELGGVDLPRPVSLAMRLCAKVMTTVAHRI